MDIGTISEGKMEQIMIGRVDKSIQIQTELGNCNLVLDEMLGKEASDEQSREEVLDGKLLKLEFLLEENLVLTHVLSRRLNSILGRM